MIFAVCDDDKYCREGVSELLNEYSKQNPQHDISVFAYEHADDIICASKKIGGFDVYILDIIMPDTDGIELGVLLREAGYDGKIIYLTSSEEYVFEAFKAQPFNYMIKPLKKERLFSVLDSAVKLIATRVEKNIMVKTCDGIVKLSLNSIVYAELHKNVILYHLTTGRVVESTTIRTSFSKAAKELVRDNCFVMCGVSLAINLQHIIAIKTEKVIFHDGSDIALSRKQLAEIRTIWCEFCLGSREDKL